ncbi:MAG: helix-turn-helix domain-containing protein [Clostridia bacterium]|nr:helix-turn-helix domain-containing protein [Clostridia bacterium]
MTGNLLKDRRTELCLSQKEVAHTVGISTQQYQQYEYGTVTPNVVMAIKIAKVLNATVEQLFNPLGGFTVFNRQV